MEFAFELASICDVEVGDVHGKAPAGVLEFAASDAFGAHTWTPFIAVSLVRSMYRTAYAVNQLWTCVAAAPGLKKLSPVAQPPEGPI